jgi:hypothetical protein
MKFGLSFTRKFRERLETKARNFGETDDGNVVVQESNVSRMYMMDGYEQSAFADNESIFHGREVRKVSTFGEKSGMMIQLSLANEDDDEGGNRGVQRVAFRSTEKMERRRRVGERRRGEF